MIIRIVKNIIGFALIPFVIIKLLAWIKAGYSRHALFVLIIVTIIIFCYFLKHLQRKTFAKKLLTIGSTLLISIAVFSFIFQYWPILSLGNIEDVLYGQSKIPPEQIVLQQKHLKNSEEVLRYFKDKNTKYFLPTFITYEIVNQSQSILPDVITRHILLSIKIDGKDKQEKSIRLQKISCSVSKEKFTFAPLESRKFLVVLKDVFGKTKPEMEWDHIFLIVTAFCRPVIFPIKTVSLKEVAYYSDSDRLWSTQRKENLEAISIKDTVEALQEMLLKNNIEEDDITAYINKVIKIENK